MNSMILLSVSMMVLGSFFLIDGFKEGELILMAYSLIPFVIVVYGVYDFLSEEFTKEVKKEWQQ